ncbi:MAG: NAD(P)H-dependent oxidoreductase subunit E [Dehalococcoidia bacterium]
MQDSARRQRYREILKDFKSGNGNLLEALHAVQHEFGWISREGVDAVARQLRMNAAAVFGTVSFYTEFRTNPPADVTVHWCSGPACRLKGGDNIRRAMEAVLETGMESKTADGRVGLHVQQCDGSCASAPLIWLRREGEHTEGPFAPLESERGEIVGPLRVADAITLARKLKAGYLTPGPLP